MTDPPGPTKYATPLRRALGLWVLVFYGLGMIIGAGIYVLVGEVAGAAGWGAPIAFLLSALLASITGLAYAELVGRLPAGRRIPGRARNRNQLRNGAVLWNRFGPPFAVEIRKRCMHQDRRYLL
jgi:MFS family permease